jgi:hypothetical protein
MAEDEDAAPQYELVLPFVLVTSKGGPFDDDAFVAGWQCAEIDQALTALAPWGATMAKTVYAQVVPQLDLIAMKHGYAMETTLERDGEPLPEGWAIAAFRPSAEERPQ